MNLFEKVRLFPDAVKGQLFCDPERNGEYKFLKKFLSTNEKLTIFDVGANVGDYSLKILSINSNVKIYCFEPVKNTFEKLSENIRHFKNVKLNNIALGEIAKEDYIYVYGNKAGVNSLYFHEYHASIASNVIKEKILIKSWIRLCWKIIFPK
ncbi:MAG: FkbM family methyltransferase [Ignavibacteriaceae bacterium]|nr:FkbM family methyltransferase [Ignavibacteriaceae bacterium]